LLPLLVVSELLAVFRLVVWQVEFLRVVWLGD
jgi:hypothetical protein